MGWITMRVHIKTSEQYVSSTLALVPYPPESTKTNENFRYFTFSVKDSDVLIPFAHKEWNEHRRSGSSKHWNPSSFENQLTLPNGRYATFRYTQEATNGGVMIGPAQFYNSSTSGGGKPPRLDFLFRFNNTWDSRRRVGDKDPKKVLVPLACSHVVNYLGQDRAKARFPLFNFPGGPKRTFGDLEEGEWSIINSQAHDMGKVQREVIAAHNQKCQENQERRAERADKPKGGGWIEVGSANGVAAAAPDEQTPTHTKGGTEGGNRFAALKTDVLEPAAGGAAAKPAAAAKRPGTWKRKNGKGN